MTHRRPSNRVALSGLPTMLLWTLVAVAVSPLGAAQETAAPEIVVPEPPAPKPTYQVQRSTATIAIDGQLDEWTSAPTFELLYETSPGENLPAPVKTEVWITYDSDRIYVAFKAHDPEPQHIRARLTDRDRASQDDIVGIVLDTFNDERRAFEFFVNPLGVQMDLFQNEVTGNEDSSFDAIWSSAGRVTEEGFVV